MRYFFSTGEASGELTAVVLAGAIAAMDPQARFEGIGSTRMRGAGFRVWHDNGGWAAMGPLAALPRIPKLLALGLSVAARLRLAPPDLIVLVDFGAFNVRLAQVLRRIGYVGPIIDVYPPGTWIDDPKRARAIAKVAMPLTAFAHQRDFFQSLGLRIAYFGHPLAPRYPARAAAPAPPADGGTVAILPGSRKSELQHHAARLFKAARILLRTRPNVQLVCGPADESGEQYMRAIAAREGIDPRYARGTLAAIADADAAWVSSGTATLECALSGVPEVVLYVVAPQIEKYAQRVRGGRFIALPNLVMQRRIVPELLQERATPERLAQEMEEVLRDPSMQQTAFAAMRQALGPPDALERCAAFAVELAEKGEA